MPRVASEAHNVLPSRPHQPAARSNNDADARAPATPFSEMLDTAEPAQRPQRAERPDRANRPKPADDRPADSKPASDNTDVKDSKASDAPKPSDGEDGNNADGAKDAKGDTADASAKSEGKTDTTTEPEAAKIIDLDATVTVANAPQPVVAAVTPALTLDAAPGAGGAPGEDALAAIAAAGQEVAKAAAPKTAPAQTGKAGEPSAKDAAMAANAPTATPQAEAAKDGQSRGQDDKAPGSFHRAAAELIARLGADKPAPDGSDAAAAKAGTDAVQNTGALTPAGNASTTAATAAAAPAQAQPQAVAVPLSSLAVEIASQASAGKRHFEIRLDPADLGRIDVKLDIDRDGNVSTRLVVDRADTLDLLKRDASTLERALQQAGLKTSDQGLDFSLRQHAFAQDDSASQNGARIIVSDDDTAPLEALRQGYGRLLGLGGGLDIRV